MILKIVHAYIKKLKCLVLFGCLNHINPFYIFRKFGKDSDFI